MKGTCIAGMETVTQTLLLFSEVGRQTQRSPFTVWPVGGRADGMRQKPGRKAWAGSVTLVPPSYPEEAIPTAREK